MSGTRRLPRAVFAECTGELEADAFAEFVADVLEARGWSVERGGPLLSLSRGDGGHDRRTVLTVPSPSALDADDAPEVDRIIAARRTPSVERSADEARAELQGPSELYDVLLFGLDRETAATISRDHLGRGIDARPGERDEPVEPRSTRYEGAVVTRPSGSRNATSTAAQRTDRSANRSGRQTRRSLVAVLLLAAVILAASIGGLGDPLLTGLGRPPDVDPVENSPDATRTASATSDPLTPAPTASGFDAGAGGTRSSIAAFEHRYDDLTPTCDRPAELVAVIIVGSLRINDPTTDDGLRAAWNFSSRVSQNATYESFADYLSRESFDPLFSYDRMEIAPAYPQPAGRAYRVTVTDPAGDRHAYHLAFLKPDRGPKEGCWLLAGIVPQ